MDFALLLLLVLQIFFYNNALKNGIIPIQMDAKQVKEWMDEAAQEKLVLTIDLRKKNILKRDGEIIPFEISTYHQKKLLNGWMILH